MHEVLFNDGENTHASLIEKDIMALFVEEEENLSHDESDTDRQLQQFKELAKHLPS